MESGDSSPHLIDSSYQEEHLQITSLHLSSEGSNIVTSPITNKCNKLGPSNPTPRTKARLLQYKKNVKKCRSRLFRMETQLNKFKSVKKIYEKQANDIESIIQKASKYLTNESLQMFATQMRLARKNKYA